MARSSIPRLPQPPTPVGGPGPGTDAPPAAGPQPFDRRVIWAGGVVFAVLMALSPRYGFHRDELYFLDDARHLQASYVDQPVLTPLLAWVSLKLFGVSLPGLRLWPALAAGATVVVSGLTARELGGGRRAQLLAAVGDRHHAGPAGQPATWPARRPYDVLAWAALALVVDPDRPDRRLPLVAGRRADPRPGPGQQAQRRSVRRGPGRRRPAVRRPGDGAEPVVPAPARPSPRRSPCPTCGGRRSTSGPRSR